tara:strand:- start:593 stop:1168 length:576 start_codon:yes stop_codon:yes gene_type:complete
MTKVKFYPTIWQTVPYTFEVMDQWDAEGHLKKDLVLKNIQATKQRLSEMNLNITQLSAIDSNGQEHPLEDFPKVSLNIKGLHTGHFLRSKSAIKLAPGTYTAFRFYLDRTGNSFVSTDKSVRSVTRYAHLDFEIENGLEIQGNEAPEVILRFDFVPYDLPVLFQKIGQFYKNSRSFMVRLVQSMEHERVKI